jgi:hypothetical protein
MRLCFFIRILDITTSTKNDAISDELLLEAWHDFTPPIDQIESEELKTIFQAIKNTTLKTLYDMDNIAKKYILRTHCGIEDWTHPAAKEKFKTYLVSVVKSFGYHHIDFNPDYQPFVKKIISLIKKSVPNVVKRKEVLMFDNKRVIRFGRLFVHDTCCNMYCLPLYCNDNETPPTHDEISKIMTMFIKEDLTCAQAIENAKESWDRYQPLMHGERY